jgi:hypothetical protein
MNKPDERSVRDSIEKPEGKRQVGRSRCRWEDNIREGVKGTVYEDVDSIGLQGPVAGSSEQGTELSGSVNSG